MASSLFSCLCLLILPVLTASDRQTPPRVLTTSGLLTGKSEQGTHQYLGVPYAHPPVGSLRFQPPEPLEPSFSERLAQEHGPACMQHSTLSFYGSTPASQSEDCLTLNIYVPEGARNLRRRSLPVMVWIHGGAYLVGGSAQFPGHHLAKEDVIVVTINYRLGIWGFFTTGNEVVPGNMGLKDQLMALKWIQDNIRAFNGNPNQVTVFGQSAGSMSIYLHMTNPRTARLFQKAIGQSGAVTNQVLLPLSSPRWPMLLKQLSMATGCTPDSSLLTCLQAVDNAAFAAMDSMFYEPIVDGPGGCVPVQPAQAWNKGKVRSIPFLTGFMADEGMSVFDLNMLNRTIALSQGAEYAACMKIVGMMLMKLFPSPTEAFSSLFTPEKQQIVMAEYFKHPEDNIDNLRSVMNFIADAMFISQTLNGAQVQASKRPWRPSNVYVYEFSYRDASYPDFPFHMGPSHSGELKYLFENCSPFDEDLCNSLRHAWATFARTGQPKFLDTFGHEQDWDRYSTGEGEHLQIDLTMTAGSIGKQKLRAAADHFWNTQIPDLVPDIGCLSGKLNARTCGCRWCSGDEEQTRP